jgi:hypothetical protein
MTLLLSYATVSSELAEIWGDSWRDTYAREWEQLVKVTWRVLRRRGNECFAWVLETPERGFHSSLRDGVWSGTFGQVVPRCPRLADRHEDMYRRWPAFIARYPRFELRLVLQDVSESIDATSWPYGYEWKLWLWAGGAPDATPEARRMPTEHHAALARLRAAAGGWWIWVEGPAGAREFGGVEWRSPAEMDALAEVERNRK